MTPREFVNTRAWRFRIVPGFIIFSILWLIAGFLTALLVLTAAAIIEFIINVIVALEIGE